MDNSYKSLFLLDKDTIYLNHGSFGACPKAIFDSLIQWQRKLENDPLLHLAVDIYSYLEKSREALSNYVDCHKDDIVFSPNPSTALNTIIKSLELHKDDEILSTNHEYGALDRSWNFICKRTGAKYIQTNIKLPLTSKAEFTNAIISRVTNKTKVIFLSHITSSTGLIFPIEKVCAFARENNILCIIDGAHAPGHIPLSIKQLDPDIYVGACHKWMCAPKGTSFLYAKKEIQNEIDPLVISWGYEAEEPSHSKFLDYHQWQGTNDYSSYLTMPDIIKFLNKYDWKNVSKKCRDNNLKAREMLNQFLNKEPISDNIFIGQMSSIEIDCKDILALMEKLYKSFKIQVPIFKWKDKTFLRISMQAYNEMEDIDKLIFALKKIS